MDSARATPACIADAGQRIVFVGGQGGVGKSTCAAAIALARAERFPNRRVVLLSTDPANALPRILRDDALPPNLRLEAQPADESYRAFVDAHRPALDDLAAAASEISDSGRLDPGALSLPGVDEVMSYLALCRITGSVDPVQVVVDTAPIGHALRLLATGSTLTTWCDALDAILAKRRYLAGLYRRNRDAEPAPADGLLRWLRAEVSRVETLIHDWARCSFVVVLRENATGAQAAATLVEALRDQRVSVRELVVNAVEARHDATSLPAWCARIARSMPGPGRRWWALPQVAPEPAGVAALRMLARSFEPIEAIEPGSTPIDPPATETLQAASTPGLMLRKPLARQPQLILVTGKGGTGKTTLATAIALAARHAGIDATLVAADPSGGLARLVGHALQDHATTLPVGIHAVQAQPQSAWARLRALFTEELAAVPLGSKAAQPVFERDAIKALADLAPPGIDECFGLLAIEAALAHARARGPALVVADMAPTGHFLRMLDVPLQVRPWLAAIHEALDMHAGALPMPRTRAALGDILARLALIDDVIHDASGCSVLVAAEPAALATAETTSLVAAITRRRITVQGVLLNRVTAGPAAASARSTLAASCPRVALLELPMLIGGSGLDLAERLSSAFAFRAEAHAP